MKKKQIGGPGYTGSFIVATYGGQRVAIWEDGNLTEKHLSSFSYTKGTVLTGFRKDQPFQSAEQVSFYTFH